MATHIVVERSRNVASVLPLNIRDHIIVRTCHNNTVIRNVVTMCHIDVANLQRCDVAS